MDGLSLVLKNEDQRNPIEIMKSIKILCKWCGEEISITHPRIVPAGNGNKVFTCDVVGWCSGLDKSANKEFVHVGECCFKMRQKSRVNSLLRIGQEQINDIINVLLKDVLIGQDITQLWQNKDYLELDSFTFWTNKYIYRYFDDGEYDHYVVLPLIPGPIPEENDY